MGYEITKVITRHYNVTFCRPFMEYGKFRSYRRGMRTASTCFCCGRKLKEDETIYLGGVEKQLNQIFCEECGKKIINYLKDEQGIGQQD